jgi:hypothetical protein
MKLKNMLLSFLLLILLGTQLYASEVSIEMDKATYTTEDNISIQVTNMSGDPEDWIAIYPKESSNEWENVVAWEYTNGFIEGSITFKNISAGEYEIRVFFEDSYILEAQYAFTVSGAKASITTNQNQYTTDEKITALFEHMSGDTQDWVAIYPKESSNDWENVIYWEYTEGLEEGQFTFDALPLGQYEVRAFFRNSYIVESQFSFNVEPKVSIHTDKREYITEEEVQVTFENMFGDSQDWIAIYPKGSSNAWENVLSWTFTDGKKSGQINLDVPPIGEYEVRAFFKNSYTLETAYSFTVEALEEVVSVRTDKKVYGTSEDINVTFEHMFGDVQDWIAIYPKGTTNDFTNIQEWKYTEGLESGTLSFNKLAIGQYEVRAFFKNSYTLESSYEFEIQVSDVNSTVYENGENGLSPNWIHQTGDYEPIHVDNDGYNSTGALALVTEWVYNTTNLALYYLPLHNNATQKILEMDVGGLSNFHIPNKPADEVGYMSHFAIGVSVYTTDGKRRMLWDSFLNHEDVSAYRTSNDDGSNVWLYYPSPVEHVRGFFGIDIHKWEHFRVDIEEQLRILEPNNNVLAVEYLFLTGGFLDNIKLSSH